MNIKRNIIFALEGRKNNGVAIACQQYVLAHKRNRVGGKH